MSYNDFELEDEEGFSRPSLDDVLAEFQMAEEDLPSPTILYGLSDLTESDIERLEPVFKAADVNFRRVLLQMLVDLSESHYELLYDEFALLALSDLDTEVRRYAIELLEESENPYVMKRLMRVAQQDKQMVIRAEATRALGHFVLAGELGDLSEANTNAVQECVLAILNGEEPLEVRRRAVEAIANCSHEIVIPTITQAYQSHEEILRISAVTAMGHSADERWQSYVLKELGSDNPMMQQAAAGAAGELQIAESVPYLARFLAEGERDLQEVVVNALGEIGSKEAVRLLNTLLENNGDDEELVALIEDALGNANLNNSKFLILDVEPED